MDVVYRSSSPSGERPLVDRQWANLPVKPSVARVDGCCARVVDGVLGGLHRFLIPVGQQKQYPQKGSDMKCRHHVSLGVAAAVIAIAAAAAVVNSAVAPAALAPGYKVDPFWPKE